MEDKIYDKVIMLADVHYGVHASSIEWLENINSYFDNFFIPLVKKEKTEKTCIVILGDYFEDRQATDINIMVSAIKNIKKLSSLVPVYMLVGNHDIYKKSGLDKSSLSCIESIPNVFIINEKYDGKALLTLTNNKHIALISWVGDHIKETALINEYKKLATFIFLHTEICGMKLDNGRDIAEGTVVKLTKDNAVFSGHIHKRQVSKSGNITYIGSPYHTERSDIGNVKGVYILSVNEDNVDLKFIPNTFSPEYIKVILSIGENGNWQLDRDINNITNNYVDVEMTEETSNVINSVKVSDELLKYKPKSLNFITIKKPIQVDTNIEYSEGTGGISYVFENTVSTMNLSKEQMDKIMKINSIYMKEAAEELGIQI